MALTALDSEDIAQLVFTIATPKAVCSILRTHSVVTAVRRQLFENADNARRDIEEFVRERLVDLKPKTYFPHEPAFCALAVALETLPMPAAEGFLSELAALKIAEMPISSRVAALGLQRRRELLTSNTQAVFKVARLPLPNGPALLRPHRVPSQSIVSDCQFSEATA
jgi:hypothetical protein